MQAKLLAIMGRSHDMWEQLADDYQVFDFESYIARTKVLAPDIFLASPEIEEIDGDIQNENEFHILTWEDGMDEIVRIYEKL